MSHLRTCPDFRNYWTILHIQPCTHSYLLNRTEIHGPTQNTSTWHVTFNSATTSNVFFVLAIVLYIWLPNNATSSRTITHVKSPISRETNVIVVEMPILKPLNQGPLRVSAELHVDYLLLPLMDLKFRAGSNSNLTYSSKLFDNVWCLENYQIIRQPCP